MKKEQDSSTSTKSPTQLPPLFMWAGGKRRLLKSYAGLFDLFGLTASPILSYVEPFVGGAAVFAGLRHDRMLRPTSKVELGDSNSELIQLFEQVRDRPQALLSAIQPYEEDWAGKTKAQRKEIYYSLRTSYWSLPDKNAKERLASSALLYFLMKTGFNGIWQTCQQSNGRFATPVGLANQTLAVVNHATVLGWSRLLEGVRLQAGSYTNIPVSNGSFVYCDPPYRASFTHYSTGWNDTDLLELIAWCRRQAKDKRCLVWLANRLTEPDDGFFAKHAKDASILVIPVVYTAGRRRATAQGFEAKVAREVLLSWDGRPTSRKGGKTVLPPSQANLTEG